MELIWVLTRGRRASGSLIVVEVKRFVKRRRRGGDFLVESLGSRKTGGISAEFVQVSTRGRRASAELVIVVSMKGRRRRGGVFLVESSGSGRKTGDRVFWVRGRSRELLGIGIEGDGRGKRAEV